MLCLRYSYWYNGPPGSTSRATQYGRQQIRIRVEEERPADKRRLSCHPCAHIQSGIQQGWHREADEGVFVAMMSSNEGTKLSEPDQTTHGCDESSPKCYLIQHNIGKKHNIGTLARCATAFAVEEVIGLRHSTHPSFGPSGWRSRLECCGSFILRRAACTSKKC